MIQGETILHKQLSLCYRDKHLTLTLQTTRQNSTITCTAELRVQINKPMGPGIILYQIRELRGPVPSMSQNRQQQKEGPWTPGPLKPPPLCRSIVWHHRTWIFEGPAPAVFLAHGIPRFYFQTTLKLSDSNHADTWKIVKFYSLKNNQIYRKSCTIPNNVPLNPYSPIEMQFKQHYPNNIWYSSCYSPVVLIKKSVLNLAQ